MLFYKIKDLIYQGQSIKAMSGDSGRIVLLRTAYRIPQDINELISKLIGTGSYGFWPVFADKVNEISLNLFQFPYEASGTYILFGKSIIPQPPSIILFPLEFGIIYSVYFFNRVRISINREIDKKHLQFAKFIFFILVAIASLTGNIEDFIPLWLLIRI